MWQKSLAKVGEDLLIGEGKIGRCVIDKQVQINEFEELDTKQPKAYISAEVLQDNFLQLKGVDGKL